MNFGVRLNLFTIVILSTFDRWKPPCLWAKPPNMGFREITQNAENGQKLVLKCVKNYYSQSVRNHQRQFLHHPTVWPSVLHIKYRNLLIFFDFRWFYDPCRNFIRSEVVSSCLWRQKSDQKVLLFWHFREFRGFSAISGDQNELTPF